MGRPVRWFGMLVAAGCLGSGACAPAGDESAPPVTLVVAIDSDPGHLNPAITTSGGVHTASEILYSGLVGLDSASVPHPDLAQAWEVLDDGLRVRFHLRTDVLWHDGAPFHAGDVRYTFEDVLLRYHSRTRASLGGILTAVSAVDSFTVDFEFSSPYGPLLQQVDVTEAPILPSHLFEGTDPLTHRLNREPVGTGPFRFESLGVGEIRYRANDEFYDGRPSVDRLVLRVIPDPGTSVIALETGEVDWLFQVPGPDRARILARDDLRFIETTRGAGGSNCVNTLGFNLDRPLFRERSMRAAVAHAIDREQIVERVLFGAGRVAGAPISSGIPWAHRAGLAVPGHDPQRAASLLDSLGWETGADGFRAARRVEGVPDGTRLRFDFVHMPGFVGYGDVLRAQLRRAGIDLELRVLETAVFAETVFTDRDFDTNVVSYCNGPDPEIGVRRQYLSTNIGPVPFSNGAAYRNPVIDSLFDQARAGRSLEERGRIYARIQEIAVRDLPYFWLTESVSTRVHRARCTGLTGAGHYARQARCEP